MLLATPALAKGPVLILSNETRSVFDSLTVYPLTQQGEPVEDVVGGYTNPIGPSDIVELPLSLERCGKVMVRLTTTKGRESRVTMDLCKGNLLSLRN